MAVFAGYRSDPEVARYQGWDAPYRIEQAELFIAEMRENPPGTPGCWYQVAIERRDSGEMIGDCAFCIVATGRQAEIGFTLARAHQGQGFATEAVHKLVDTLFGAFAVHRVTANCDVDNLTSVRLLERIGMRLEGQSLSSYWDGREWRSEYWYAVLREEWYNRVSGA